MKVLFMKYVVMENDELYSYLRRVITNKSKNNIKFLLKNGCVIVNNQVITKYNYVLSKGDVIEINKNKKLIDNNLSIIYEDNNIIVVDKPSKLLTISNKNEKENTLYRMVSDYSKKTREFLPGIKNEKIQKLYQDNWNKLAKVREYYAVVEGITNGKGHIESYLKQTKTLLVYSSKNNDGYFAITDYEKVKNNNKYSLLKINISTGRRNQIRCHMHDINHPIVGDNRYQSKTNPINRLALHASKLIITDPITKNDFIFVSNIPNEFYGLVK